MELRRNEEFSEDEQIVEEDDNEREEAEDEGAALIESSASRFGATMLASRFAANALRGVHRLRSATAARGLVSLQKPPKPDFAAD